MSVSRGRIGSLPTRDLKMAREGVYRRTSSIRVTPATSTTCQEPLQSSAKATADLAAAITEIGTGRKVRGTRARAGTGTDHQYLRRTQSGVTAGPPSSVRGHLNEVANEVTNVKDVEIAFATGTDSALLRPMQGRGTRRDASNARKKSDAGKGRRAISATIAAIDIDIGIKRGARSHAANVQK